jgi:hypothetical protein
MVKILSVLLILGLTGCATVPDSVKVALEKEGAAIHAVESDYNTSVNRYHAELINQIDARLNDIFKYEVEKIEASGKKLTASDVMKLEENRRTQRASLIKQADQAKEKYLNSKNLAILKALHEKVLQYAESDKFTASGFAAVLTELDAEINKIKEEKKEKE